MGNIELAAQADPTGSLTMGIIGLLFGFILLVKPDRLLHPFKGKKASTPMQGILLMQFSGLFVVLGGLCLTGSAAWALFTRSH